MWKKCNICLHRTVTGIYLSTILLDVSIIFATADVSLSVSPSGCKHMLRDIRKRVFVALFWWLNHLLQLLKNNNGCCAINPWRCSVWRVSKLLASITDSVSGVPHAWYNLPLSSSPSCRLTKTARVKIALGECLWSLPVVGGKWWIETITSFNLIPSIPYQQSLLETGLLEEAWHHQHPCPWHICETWVPCSKRNSFKYRANRSKSPRPQIEFPPKFFHGSLVMGSKTFANFVSSRRLAYLHLQLPMSTFMKPFNYWLRVNLTYPFSIPDDSASNAIPWDRFPLPVHPSGNEAPEVWPKVWMQNVPTLQSQSDLSIFILLRSKQKGILWFMI